MTTLTHFREMKAGGSGFKSRLNIRMNEILKARVEACAADWNMTESELSRMLISLCLTLPENKLKTFVTERYAALKGNEETYHEQKESNANESTSVVEMES